MPCSGKYFPEEINQSQQHPHLMRGKWKKAYKSVDCDADKLVVLEGLRSQDDSVVEILNGVLPCGCPSILIDRK